MEQQRLRLELQHTKNIQNENLLLSIEECREIAAKERRRRNLEEEEEEQHIADKHDHQGRIVDQNLALQSLGSGNLVKFRPKHTELSPMTTAPK